MFRSDERHAPAARRGATVSGAHERDDQRSPSTRLDRFVSCAAMAREEYLDHLASVPLFSGCTTKELRDIAKATVELTSTRARSS